MNKVAIYTAIFGGYDLITSLSHKSGKCDYFLFTDKEVLSDFWNVVVVDSLEDLDDTRKARYLKVNGHPILERYDVTVWIDGNVDIVSDIRELEEGMSSFDLCTFKHPTRNCIYKEALACSLYMKDSHIRMFKHLFFLMKSKYPLNNGLVETNVLIRKNTPEIKRINALWWNMIRQYSKRDQLSFNYVLWSLGYNYSVMGQENARGKSAVFKLKGFHRKTSLYIMFGLFVKRIIVKIFLG